MQKEKILSLLAKHRKLMEDAERFIWQNPETGFREKKSSEYMARRFEELGYVVTRAEGIPGFFTLIDTGRNGPCVLVLAELDSLISENHPERDKQTNTVHSCGHHVQCASLLGLAAILKDRDILSSLCGKIKLCCVPAEEMIEEDYRRTLIESGKIKYMTGKREFLARGFFDDCDMALMIHASYDFCVNLGNAGAISKIADFRGVSAHAGGSPELGINSLYAANVALCAANAVRETFTEKDMIRFHPIITHGGESVNAIPEKTRLQSYVRGANITSVSNANFKINRALIGGALSLGANVKIVESLCYFPLKNDEEFIKLIRDAAEKIIPEENLKFYQSISAGSTDLGDLSALMPCVHTYSGGAFGKIHGDDFKIVDTERALTKSAALLTMALNLLLEKKGERAKRIIKNYKPEFKNRQAFFRFIQGFEKSEEAISYKDVFAKIKF
jgi:amidohydrolase